MYLLQAKGTQNGLAREAYRDGGLGDKKRYTTILKKAYTSYNIEYKHYLSLY